LNFLSIKHKLIISLSIVLIFAFVIMNIVNYQVSKASVRDSIIKDNLPLIQENIYLAIKAELSKPIFIASSMGNDTFLKNWVLNGEQDIEQIKKYLSGIKDQYGVFTSFFISAASRNYYHYNGILKQISPKDAHDVWYYKFIDMNVAYDLDVDNNQAAKDLLAVFVNQRLEDNQSNLLGVTGVGLQMDQIGKTLKKFQDKYKQNIYLVDSQGLVQIHYEKEYIENRTLLDLTGIGSIGDEVLIKSLTPVVYEYDKQGQHFILSVRYLPILDWYLVVEQDQNTALAGIKYNFMRNMIFAFIIICIVLALTIFTVNFYQSQLERMAVTDELTGAFNRRELELTFERTLKTAEREKSQVSVILIDIDKFKGINDNHGHLVGDIIIKKIVNIINEDIRGQDFLVRWGGDELMIISNNPMDIAIDVAERIRRIIEENEFLPEKPNALQVTISCGVAQFSPPDTLDSLTKRADEALYTAKEKGRNTVVCKRLRG
jgi:diguanylate cyclase (GGDEF)-like protein